MSLIEDLGGFEDRDPHPADKAAAEADATRAERAVPRPEAPKPDAPAAEHLAPRWRAAAPVLCLAGKGPLDGTGIAMVCVSYLEISGSPSGLHHLVRRLRERMPGAKILVGLWPTASDAPAVTA